MPRRKHPFHFQPAYLRRAGDYFQNKSHIKVLDPIELMIKKHFLDENKGSDGNGIINVNCSPRWLSVCSFSSGLYREEPQSRNMMACLARKSSM